MRVTVHPAGDDACALYRMESPARVLAAQGADVTVTRDLAFSATHTADGQPIALVETPETDVVVMQRPLLGWKCDLIRLLQRAGVAVVVELDDDFGSVHPENPAWPVAHREWMTSHQWAEVTDGAPLPPERFRTTTGVEWVRAPGVLAPMSDLWLRRACRMADLVTVTTPALAERYAPHGRVTVLPNLVPEWYLSVEAEAHDGVTVGWGGSVATHPGDLEVTGGGVARAVEQTGAEFRVVGTGVGVRRSLGLAVEPTVSGWVELGDWPRALAGLDVGIVPLAPSRFNEAKSALKMLEYAACGVPCVVSPTPDNMRLVREGVGLPATIPDDWRALVSGLVQSGAAREDFGGACRRIAARHTYEAHGGRWWDAWAKALDNRRAGAREAAAA